MRIRTLKLEEMSPRQKEIHDFIVNRRGRMGGPYPIWLHSPELCERAEALSAYCRFECSLHLKLRELSILLTARHFDAQFAWQAHLKPCIEAGINPKPLEAIAARQEPVFDHPDEQIFYQFTMELLRNHFVSDATFEAAKKQFGEVGVLDIVACTGNFTLLAMLLNAFLVDLKEGTPPFADIGTRPYPKK